MTKKDYISIANSLRVGFNTLDDRYVHEDNKAIVADVCYEFCERLAIVFEADNPRFDKNRFIDAVVGV